MKKITIISLMLMSLLIIALITVIITRPNDAPKAEQTHSVEHNDPQKHPQRGREVSRRKIENFQMQQIEQSLKLSDDRLERFREVYTEYTEATKPPRNNNSPFGSMAKLGKLSDEEIERGIIESYQRSKNSIEVKQEYYNRFREFMTPREVAIMYEIERRTRERFLDEFERRNERAKQPREIEGKKGSIQISSREN